MLPSTMVVMAMVLGSVAECRPRRARHMDVCDVGNVRDVVVMIAVVIMHCVFHM